MADAKKPDKKGDKPPAPKKDPFVEVVGFIGLMFVVLFLANGILQLFSNSGFLSRGFSELTSEGIMSAHTRAIASLERPIGGAVVSTQNDTAVYDLAGGRQIGEQSFYAQGKITKGPEMINGTTYYYVEFQSGKSGWVDEQDIAYVQSQPNVFENFVLWFYTAIPAFEALSVVFSILLILTIIFIVTELKEIRKAEKAKRYPTATSARDHPPVTNQKWEKILTQLESQNENDWKLAVIEADSILSDIIDTLSLPGDTLGEKMKAIEKSDLTSINSAWEAHKIRNQIAHEGSDFVLTQREARRVIGLYEQVFKELEVI